MSARGGSLVAPVNKPAVPASERWRWRLAGHALFDFLGHRGNRIPHPADDGLQGIGGHAKPPRQRADLRRIGCIDLVSDRLMSDALHDRILVAATVALSEPTAP